MIALLNPIDTLVAASNNAWKSATTTIKLPCQDNRNSGIRPARLDRSIHEVRWNQLFQKPQATSPHPTILSSGQGDWPDHVLEVRDQFGARLERAMYIAFDSGTGLSQWEELRQNEVSHDSLK